MKKLIFIFIITLLFFGCKKKVHKSNYSELIGEYEWSWSVDSGVYGNNIYDHNSISEKYAFSIEENGDLVLYENGGIALSGVFKIREVIKEDYGKRIKVVKKKVEKYFYIYNNGEVTSRDFPYLNYSNVFYKVK